MLNPEDMQSIVSECKFEEYIFFIAMDNDNEETLYLQGRYTEPDIISGEPSLQRTRKWKLSPYMTKSELVQTVFKCAITSYEHRAREHFTYRGRRVFGPHFDVDALWEICNKLDYREPS